MWYIVALVTFLYTGEQDIKYHTSLKFQSFQECNEFYVQYKDTLEEGLKRAYPSMEKADVRCLDEKTMLMMLEALKRTS